MNGIYWNESFPKFVTREFLSALEQEGKLRLLSIADITCDIEASVQMFYLN